MGAAAVSGMLETQIRKNGKPPMRHLADQLEVRCLVTFLRTVVTVWGTVPRTRSKRDKLDCPSKLYLLPLARTVSIASLIGSYEPAMILAGSTAGLDYAPIACGESGLITNVICVDVDQSILFFFTLSIMTAVPGA